MKLLIATIALWAWTSYGQTIIHYPDSILKQKEPEEHSIPKIDVESEIIELECICNCESSDPEFPGGEAAMMKYIQDNIKIPEAVYSDGLCSYRGTCYVQFTINKCGDVQDVKVIRGIHPDFDEEVVKLIQNMPQWIPAVENGKVAIAKYTLPIHLNYR